MGDLGTGIVPAGGRGDTPVREALLDLAVAALVGVHVAVVATSVAGEGSEP